ncbi:hypothetical protein NBRC116187_07840 [Halopseudomonas sabulinigri]|uniref:Uncharacterized protein n=2 Tax=Halopseudomonas sabulinigri TaxID=472181 RepID=A0ABP9ZLU6_9GAMM
MNGKCQRSSHYPEAVHLHLNTYPFESGAAQRVVRERVNSLSALMAGSVAIISRADHSFSFVGGDRMALFLGLGSFVWAGLPGCKRGSSLDYSSIF